MNTPSVELRNKHQALLQRRHALSVTLADLCLSLDSGAQSSSSSVNTEITRVREQMNNLSASISSFESANPSLVTPAPTARPPKSHEDLVKDLREIADGANGSRKFRVKDSGDKFWRNFSHLFFQLPLGCPERPSPQSLGRRTPRGPHLVY